MGHWNYRLVHYKEGDDDYYRIQEIYYQDDGHIYLYNDGAVVGGFSVREAKQTHRMLLEAFRAPVIEAKDLPTEEEIDRMETEMDMKNGESQ